MKLLNPLRRNRCHLCCVEFFIMSILFYCFPQYRGHSHILAYRLCPQIQVVAVVEDVSCSNYMAYSGERVSIELPSLCSPRRFNGLVLLVIGGRSNACCAFLTGLQYSVLPLNGCAASFTCAGHFLAFTSCSLNYILPSDLCRSF